MQLFGLILIGTAAGCFAERFLTGKGFGVIADLIVGVTGALVGGALFENAGIFSGGNLIGSLLFATTGAIASLYGVRRIKKA